MQYVILKLKITEGEREYEAVSLHTLFDSIDMHVFSETWAQGFYGEEDAYDEEFVGNGDDAEDHYFFSGEVCVQVDEVRAVPEDEFKILKQYL